MHRECFLFGRAQPLQRISKEKHHAAEYGKDGRSTCTASLEASALTNRGVCSDCFDAQRKSVQHPCLRL